MKKSLLSLVGAGPGDPDLLTLKALKCLERADVVLYDALVSERVLALIPASTLKVYVGKRCGQHSLNQEAINELIISYSKRFPHVARLKGGDPFIFGRGQEEINYAKKHGLYTEVIPGISSAIGLPTHYGIPLTKRGIHRSFWVLTATDQRHQLGKDLDYAAQSSATLVILMGTRKLPFIVEKLLSHRDPYCAIALVQNGSLPSEKVIIGQLQDILELAAEHQFSSPGIIIIGEGVKDYAAISYEVIRTERPLNTPLSMIRQPMAS